MLFTLLRNHTTKDNKRKIMSIASRFNFSSNEDVVVLHILCINLKLTKTFRNPCCVSMFNISKSNQIEKYNLIPIYFFYKQIKSFVICNTFELEMELTFLS